VCLSPGAIHWWNGLYDAKPDDTPLLAIARMRSSMECRFSRVNSAQAGTGWTTPFEAQGVPGSLVGIEGACESLRRCCGGSPGEWYPA